MCYDTKFFRAVCGDPLPLIGKLKHQKYVFGLDCHPLSTSMLR